MRGIFFFEIQPVKSIEFSSYKTQAPQTIRQVEVREKTCEPSFCLLFSRLFDGRRLRARVDCENSLTPCADKRAQSEKVSRVFVNGAKAGNHLGDKIGDLRRSHSIIGAG